MNRLKTFSYLLVILLPLITLYLSLSMGSLGFFFYSLPGAIAPGLTGILLDHFRKTPVEDRSMTLER